MGTFGSSCEPWDVIAYPLQASPKAPIYGAVLASPPGLAAGVGPVPRVVGGGPELPPEASILVSDCHVAASRTACFRGQADPPPPLWFGGFAFFHDCQVIHIFPPRPPPPHGVVSAVSPKTVSFLFCFKQSDLLHPPEVWVAVFLQ